MNHAARTFSHLAFGIAMAAAQLHAQTLNPAATTIPEAYVVPSSAADISKPGFILRISQVAQDTHPNLLANAEKQLAGGFGDNLADPAAVSVATGPAQPPSPSTAPIRFEIPTVINLNKTDAENRGDFTPNQQMPGLPGTTASSDNVAGEILTYLDLPVGNIVMGVISATYSRVQIGGVTLGDQFGVAVGQLEGGSRWGYSFNVNITKAGLYPARLLFENAGNDRTYVQWFTGVPGAKVLINDIAHGGIKAFRALTTPASLADSGRLIPGNGDVNVAPLTQFHAELVDGSAAIDKATVSAQLDGVAVSPGASVVKTGSRTSVDFSNATALAPGVHTAALVYTEGGNKVARSWSFTVSKYVSLDPTWRVTDADKSKPGFNWNIFANSDAGNQANSVARAEIDLSLLAVDAAGAPLPNLADPNAKGAALAAASAPSPANAPIHFEIDGTISLDATSNMPGAPSTDGISNGQAAEILTYLTLPAGVITMVISHDDAFSTAAGPNPQDAFGRVELASNAGATTTSFSFLVQAAGTYPFRTVWENGGGGSVLRWSTAKSDGTTVLVNDVANGGIPAFRATTSVSKPYVQGANPLPVPRQLESTSSGVTVVLADGGNAIADNSVSLQVDGKAVTAAPTRQGKYLIIKSGDLPGFHAAGEAHSAVLTFKDSAGNTRTQQWPVYNLENLILPAKPVAGEDFNSYSEATGPANTVPPGWVAFNYTLPETPGWSLASQNSDAFTNWVIISTDTVAAIEKEVMQNDPTQRINGAPIGDSWMTGNLMFAASDGRAGNGNPQVHIAVTKPFDLSKVSNPVLTFYSGQRITGNQSEANAVEYSVDGGKTWLPAAYYQKSDTIFLNPDGSYDALTMFNNVNGHTPSWAVPGVTGISGGTFGAAIAAPVSQSLAPFIAERSDAITSRRVEAIRLAQAGSKSDVRLRFSHVGSCGWEWGLDNIAFYDIAPSVAPSTSPHIDSIAVATGKITITWSNGGTLESAPTLSNPTWTSTGNNTGSFSENVPASGSKFYRVKQ